MFPDSSPERSALVAAHKNGVNTEELWTQLRRRFIKSGSVLEVQRATLVIGLFQRSARQPSRPGPHDGFFTIFRTRVRTDEALSRQHKLSSPRSPPRTRADWLTLTTVWRFYDNLLAR